MKKLFTLITLMLAISACTPTTNSLTHSGFQTPLPNGDIATSLTSSRRGSDSNFFGDGYAYAVGAGANGNFYGYAGLLPATIIPAPPASGTATFSGTYELARITDISISGKYLMGLNSLQSGALTLTANFGSGTLTGGNAVFSVDGAFTGARLTGNVDYLGQTGALIGLVGSTGAVGAFHSNSGTDVYAGGFMVGNP